MSSNPSLPRTPETRPDVMIVTPAWRYMTHTFPDGRPLREPCEEALKALVETLRSTWREVMGEGSSTPEPKYLPDHVGVIVPLGLFDKVAGEAHCLWSLALRGTNYGATIVHEYLERLGGPDEVKKRMRAKIDAHNDGATESTEDSTSGPDVLLVGGTDSSSLPPPSEKK